jgi:hypothetical protein
VEAPEGAGAPEGMGVRKTLGPGRRSGAPRESGEKEAGAAGGESGARAHGPALGGEAGSVLIRKLIHK